MSFFNSNYDYDIIIIGGGISGLFTAYKLSETNKNIILFESSNSLGGKIVTINKGNGISYEAGAARFHHSHGKILALIHELELQNDIIKLPKKINHILRNSSDNYTYKTENTLNLSFLLNEAISNRDKMSKETLETISFFQYLTMLFDNETALFIKDSFGYDSEILHLNAYSALYYHSDDLLKDNKYYILANGLSQIIMKLSEKLKQKENVIVKTNTEVKGIDGNHVITAKGEKFNFNKLILSIPHSKLKGIDYFKNKLPFDSIKPIKLLRIYAKYPTNNLWFQDIERTTTDNILRHIIPINKKNGLIMISYTDDIYAEMWNNNYKVSEEFLIKTIHQQIYNLFKITPPKPDFFAFHYWENGIHVWKPNNDTDKLYKSTLKPDKNKEIYLVGETFSKKQGWVEGALETCYDVLKLLSLDGYKIISSKATINDK